MVTMFFVLFSGAILAELIKGLSANGTPPVLQSFSWQLDLAYKMWSKIRTLRLFFFAALILLALSIDWTFPTLAGALIYLVLWGGLYWVFTHFWVGRVKFLPITRKEFLAADQNQISEDVQIIGVDLNGVQKAYPVAMLFYHHQISDEVGGHPIWATYCGLCRSGRIYDTHVEGLKLDFVLIGAITYNAIFKDNQTGTWWRQETGEAVRGKLAGQQLQDIWCEQMSLKNWLTKHPSSLVLQYDPKFIGNYTFLTSLLAYEASLPGWHRQETPPLVIGVEVGESARAYDFEQLKKHRLLNDEVGSTALLILSDGDDSGFAYSRTVGSETLEFAYTQGVITDVQSGSTWNIFGCCVAGAMKGKKLATVLSRQQFLRSWIDFHSHTTFYEF